MLHNIMPTHLLRFHHFLLLNETLTVYHDRESIHGSCIVGTVQPRLSELEMQPKCRVKVQVVTAWSICACAVNLHPTAVLRESATAQRQTMATKSSSN
jgi:hypothetical protein